MNNIKIAGMFLIVGIVVAFATLSRGEWQVVKTNQSAQKEESLSAKVPASRQGFRLQGKLDEDISGKHTVLLNVYADEIYSELITQKEFPIVEFDKGFYTIDVDPAGLGLLRGKDYWLTIDIPETELPTQEAKLEIVAKNTIQLNADGQERGTITGGQDYVGNFSDYMVKIMNRGTGYTIWAISENGTAVFAQASTADKYAVHAQNLTGTALKAEGDVQVIGDTDISGNLTVSGETSVNLPVGSVSTIEIADGTITETDISPAAKINADTLDNKDSSEFITPWIKNGSDIYYNDGNVGIGTTNPQAKLDTIGSSDIEGEPNVIARFRASDAGSSDAGIIIGSQNGNAPYISDAAGGGTSLGLFFRTNNAARMMIDTLGNVGIGTTNPQAKLDTIGSSDIEGEPNVIARFRASDAGSSDAGIIIGSQNGNAPYISDAGGGGTSLGLLFRTNHAARMMIDTLGNVGIGTTNPSEILDVAGNVKGTGLCIGTDCRTTWPTGIGGSGSTNYVPKFTGSTTIGNSVIYDNGNVGIGTTAPEEKFHVAGNIKAKEIYGLSNASLKIGSAAGYSTAFTVGGTEYMRVDNSGNVGIGETNPQSLLDVNGNIAADALANVQIARAFTSAGIQSAIDNLPSSGGKVFLPAGTYTVSAAIKIPSNVILQGAGRSTILKQTTANIHILTNRDSTGNSGIVIKDLAIDADNKTTQGGYAGIYLVKPVACHVENVRVVNAYRGVRLDLITAKPAEGFRSDSTLHNVQVIDAIDKAFSLEGTDHLMLSNCLASSKNKEGFWASNADYVTLTNCHAIGNGEAGFKPSYGSDHWTFNSCIARDNAWSGFDLAETTEAYHVLNGCIAENNQSRGGFRTTVAKVTFNGCYARNNKNSGIKIDGLYRPIYDITISGGIFESNISEGIVIEGSQYTISDVTINGIRATNQSYGVQATGSYQYIILTGSDTRGSSTDGINIPGTNVIIANNFEN